MTAKYTPDRDFEKDMRESLQRLEVITNDISYIKDDVKEIKDNLKAQYVTREEFEPIKRGFYGLVSTILLAFVGAVIALIIKT